jgi:hypothetical protein
MITFSNLGKYGNLGNQLFQIASLIGLGERFGHHIILPEWQYCNHFDNIPPTYPVSGKQIEEKNYHYDIDQFKELSQQRQLRCVGVVTVRKIL